MEKILRKLTFCGPWTTIQYEELLIKRDDEKKYHTPWNKPKVCDIYRMYIELYIQK